MHLLSDELLLETYANAVRQKLDKSFIDLLYVEIQARGLTDSTTIAS